jgi:hypothetical protein
MNYKEGVYLMSVDIGAKRWYIRERGNDRQLEKRD